MHSLEVVIVQPLGRSIPYPLGILIAFVINGPMHPLRHPVPIGRLLGNEVMWHISSGKVVVKYPSKFTTVVVLYRDDFEFEIPLCILKRQNGVLALFAFKYGKMILMGERIKYRKLIFPLSAFIDIFHILLRSFS